MLTRRMLSSCRQEQAQPIVYVGTELDTGRVSSGVPQSEGKRGATESRPRKSIGTSGGDLPRQEA